jgi:hypothetical protein
MPRGHETPPPHLDPESLGVEGVNNDTVNARVAEILIDRLAYARIKEDHRAAEALKRASEAEQAINLEARPEAERIVRRDYEAEEEETVTDPRENLEQIYHRLGEVALGRERRRDLRSELGSDVSEYAHEEREHTLGIGRRIAARLREDRVRPDVEIFIQGSETVADRSGFKRHGRDKLFRAKKENPTYAVPGHTNRGWQLEVRGTADDTSRVILLEDGGILVAYGRHIKAADRAGRKDPEAKRNGWEFSMDRLDVRPNRPRTQEEVKRKPAERAMRKETEYKIIPERTYTRVITEDLHSDIGLPNSSEIGAAARRSQRGETVDEIKLSPEEGKLLVAREKSLQDAMVRLLYKNDVPLEPVDDTPRG